jgi:hypothetical protein
MYLCNIIALLLVRPLAEKAFEKAEKSTGGRITSILQGLFCTVLICGGQWKEAVATTLGFFCVDLFYEEIYGRPRLFEMKLHHALGIALCAYSLYTKSYIGSQAYPTKALVALEICNPLLHFLVILKNEDQLYRFPSYCTRFMKGMLIAQFFTIRLLILGAAIAHCIFFYKPPYYLIAMGVSMWAMQVVWFTKLIMKY